MPIGRGAWPNHALYIFESSSYEVAETDKYWPCFVPECWFLSLCRYSKLSDSWQQSFGTSICNDSFQEDSSVALHALTRVAAV